jgi:hypothetical protein
LKISVGKHRKFNTETHTAFVAFKKASDRAKRRKLLEILANDDVPQKKIKNIHDAQYTNLNENSQQTNRV